VTSIEDLTTTKNNITERVEGVERLSSRDVDVLGRQQEAVRAAVSQLERVRERDSGD